MDPRTGKMYEITSREHLERLNRELGTTLVPITDEDAKVLLPLSNRKRKALLGGLHCPCASGKSFKKCCWKKYKHK